MFVPSLKYKWRPAAIISTKTRSVYFNLNRHNTRRLFFRFQSFGGNFLCKWINDWISEKSKRRVFTVSWLLRKGEIIEKGDAQAQLRFQMAIQSKRSFCVQSLVIKKYVKKLLETVSW